MPTIIHFQMISQLKKLNGTFHPFHSNDQPASVCLVRKAGQARTIHDVFHVNANLFGRKFCRGVVVAVTMTTTTAE